MAIRDTDPAGVPTGPDLYSAGSHSTVVSAGTVAWASVDLPPKALFPAAHYALVLRQPGTPATFDARCYARNAAPLYPDGAAFRSTDGGTTWLPIAGVDFLFQVWGHDPPEDPEDAKVISNWAPVDQEIINTEDGITIVIYTDIPCHLFKRYSLVEPRKHKVTRIERGLPVPWNTYYCFVAWYEEEQLEEGDTYVHTFPQPEWAIAETHYYYLSGLKRMYQTPSASPIFKLTRPPLPPPPTGTITGEIATLEFDPITVATTRLIHIAGTTYAVVYHGSGNDGHLVTLTINDDGTMGPLLDAHEFDPATGMDPDVIHLAGTVYAIAYRGPGSIGRVVTYSIDADGTIGPQIHAADFETGYYPALPRIVHVAGTVYAIFYRGPDSDGWIKTLEITDAGVIGPVLHEWEFNPIYGSAPSPLLVAPNVWAFAYRADRLGGPGRVTTIRIADNGIISGPTSSVDYDTNQNDNPCLFHVSGNVYAVCSTGPGYDGWLYTLTIGATGIVGPVLDTYEFDPIYGRYTNVVAVGDNVWAIAYQGPDSDGWLRTITIQPWGTIEGEVDSFEFSPIRASNISQLHISGNVYAIAYSGPDYDGWLQTIGIVTPS